MYKRYFLLFQICPAYHGKNIEMQIILQKLVWGRINSIEEIFVSSWMNLEKIYILKIQSSLFECKWCRNLGFGINIGSLSALRCRNQQCCRTGGTAGLVGHILTDESALSQPERGGDYVHHNTTCRSYFHTFQRPWPGPSPQHLLPIGYYYYYSTSKVSIDLIQR